MLDAWLDVLCPPRCVGCGEVLPGPRPPFCEGCVVEVLELPDVTCTRCGEPGRFASSRCGRCRRSPPPFVAAWAPFEHEGAVARAIHRLKYEDRPEVAKPLAARVVELGAAVFARRAGVVCPVPTHTRRRLERGYDHAAIFAAQLARALGRPLADGWLERTRETVRQVGLTESQRATNLRGAFVAQPDVRGRQVVLVDDVFTTGATAREAASTLRAAGASSVFVVTIARARRVLALG